MRLFKKKSYVKRNGSKIYKNKYDQYHRLDGPAIEYKDGHKEWFVNGKHHRVNGPAIEYANGDKFWYKNDKLHRIDGPAVKENDGSKKYYYYHIEGKELTLSEFLKECKPKLVKYSDRLEYIINIDGDNILHRLDRPAVIYLNGAIEWWYNGKLHRNNGPAIDYSNINDDERLKICEYNSEKENYTYKEEYEKVAFFKDGEYVKSHNPGKYQDYEDFYKCFKTFSPSDTIKDNTVNLLKRENEKIDEDLIKYKQKVNYYERKIESNELLIDSYDKEIKDLKNQLKSKTISLDIIGNNYRSSMEEIEKLQKENLSINEKLENQHLNNLNELSREFKILKDKYLESEEKEIKHLSEIEKLNEENEELLEKIKEKEEEEKKKVKEEYKLIDTEKYPPKLYKHTKDLLKEKQKIIDELHEDIYKKNSKIEKLNIELKEFSSSIKGYAKGYAKGYEEGHEVGKINSIYDYKYLREYLKTSYGNYKYYY